jgi:hypothetical protein
MKKCKKCENPIPQRIYLEGQLKTTNNRLYCFECSPFKQHNTKQLHLSEEKPVMNICRICEKEYPGGHQQHKNICNTCRTTRSRQNKKRRAVEYMGGKCIVCNYDKCIAALHFHHIEPHDKEFGFSSNMTKPFEVLQIELNKCIIVCSNCHSEVHAGLIEIDEYVVLQNEIRQTYIPETKPVVSYAPVVKISKRPDKETLEKLVWEMSCVKIGEMYGVSDNAVNKWCKFYGIQKPGRGDWEKIKFGKLEIPKH